MTEPALKDMLESAMAGQPGRTVSADSVIARGRAMRSHRRRTALGAGIGGLAVAGVAALVVPILVHDEGVPVLTGPAEVWPYETPAQPAPVTDPPPTAPDAVFNGIVASPDDLDRTVEWFGAPVEQELWEAVKPILPADVALAEDGRITRSPGGEGYGLSFAAMRGDTAFTVDVVVHQARPGLHEFRPCTEPAQTPDDVALWSQCSQGYDDDGRWRVVGRAGDQTGVAIAEGGSAAVTVEWSATIHDVTNATDVVGEFADSFTFEEANAIAEASWAVASRHDADELAAGMEPGWDLEVVKQDWPDVQAALEETFGPVEEVAADLTNPDAVTATYATETSGDVTIAVWSGVERYYEGLCHDATACDFWPGSTAFFTPLIEDGPGTGGGTSGSVGRQLYIAIEQPESPATFEAVYPAVARALGMRR